MRIAVTVTLTDEERSKLTKWSRGRSTPSRLVLRAKIVRAAAEGCENKVIAAQLGCLVSNGTMVHGPLTTLFTTERLATLRRQLEQPSDGLFATMAVAGGIPFISISKHTSGRKLMALRLIRQNTCGNRIRQFLAQMTKLKCS